MSLSAIQAVRDYAEDLVARNVLAVSPMAIMTRLGCDEEQAVALMKKLCQEGYGDLRGYVRCHSCNEGVPLKATILSEMIGEAAQLAGQPCHLCGREIAIGREDIEVQLSFFLKAVADPKAMAAGSISQPVPPLEGIKLSALRSADQLNVGQLIVVQSGGHLVMQKDDHQAKSESLRAPANRATMEANLSGKMDFSGEKSSSLESIAVGRETYHHRQKRSKLAAFFLGESEEERHREGNYNENASKRANATLRISIIVVVALVISAAIALLIHLFRSL